MDESELLATAREYAIELLLALDTRQKNHKPRPHAEIVELAHGLLELIDPTPAPVNPLAEYLRILKDPANDDDHPGGTAA